MRQLKHLAAALLVAVAALAPGAGSWAEGERAGAFDYFVLALSWSPSFCALEGDARRAVECRSGSARSFTLHGLWPQSERGWPSHCRTEARDPTRAETARMADVMGSGGLAWYEWQKHGRCSGLSAEGYFALSRRALQRVEIPPVLAGLERDVKLPARVVEEAFLEVNPGLGPDGVTVTCTAGRIREVRICLTKDLAFRDCAPDTRRDCRMQDALMEGLR